MIRLRSFVSLLVLGGFAAAQSPTLDYPALLARLTDVDWLWRAPLAGEQCVQWSSYDRASHKGPGDHDAWYANGDRGQHLRVEDKGGAKEFVMVDAKGPGCIARIWSANPQGTLHFDVDGARVWSVDFLALCSGKVEHVPEPLAGMRAKGGNCHLPIPFQQSLVVSCTSGETYYAFDVVQWADGTRVPSFTPALMRWCAADVRKLVERLLHEPRMLLGSRMDSGRVQLMPGIEVLGVYTRPSGAAVADAAVMRAARLVVRCGPETTVDVPAAAFFAVGTAPSPWRSAMVGVDTAWYSMWSMPMPDGGSVELVGDDGRPLDWWLSVSMRERDDLGGSLRFRASYHLVKGTPSRPFSDHLVLDAKGQGRFVGCSLLVRNPSRIWWGEGDEKFTVDGEAFPSWFGTGTEDYFGYAWCDTALFSSPFHAQVECQGPGNFGFTQLHRTHVLDSVPFQRSFRFDLERWHWVPDVAVDYATVAYWYGAPGATSGLPPVPPAKDRELPRLERPPVFTAENALEGEALAVVSCSGGVHEVQDVSFLEKQFSGDAQRWWRDGKPGDTLVLAVPVAAAGRYRVHAALVQAEDYAIVQLALGGVPLGERFDGYWPHVRTTGARELGTVELPAGTAELRVELVGHHADAVPRGMFGLDYLRLERLP